MHTPATFPELCTWFSSQGGRLLANRSYCCHSLNYLIAATCAPAMFSLPYFSQAPPKTISPNALCLHSFLKRNQKQDQRNHFSIGVPTRFLPWRYFSTHAHWTGQMVLTCNTLWFGCYGFQNINYFPLLAIEHAHRTKSSDRFLLTHCRVSDSVRFPFTGHSF